MKIWYQSAMDLEGNTHYRDALLQRLNAVKVHTKEIVLRGRGNAAGGISMVDIIASPILYHQAITPVFVKAVLAAQDEGADAFIIGTYSEPIVPELRSLSTIPIVTMPEASMFAACMVAQKFALVTLNRTAVSYMAKSVAFHKLADRVSGIYVVDEKMGEEELNTQFDTPDAYLGRVRKACRKAVEEGAEAIIPAEGVLAAIVVNNGLTTIDGAPIVDPIGTPLLFAELAVEMKRKLGLRHSRISYPYPIAAAMQTVFGRAASENP
jgi:allantoin racemase